MPGSQSQMYSHNSNYLSNKDTKHSNTQQFNPPTSFQYDYDKIEWSNGGVGLSETVISTKSLAAYTATIFSNGICNTSYEFAIIQFDSICCNINNAGITNLIPSNRR